MKDETTVAASNVQALDARHVLQTYRRAPIVLVRGSGVRVYDDAGREYLDMISGIGVASSVNANVSRSRSVQV